jgi:ABC-type multidrug transport system ATPase subunit
MALCEIEGVCKDYGSGPLAVRALSNVDLVVEKGEFTVFSGPSGSGKTTLSTWWAVSISPRPGSFASTAWTSGG